MEVKMKRIFFLAFVLLLTSSLNSQTWQFVGGATGLGTFPSVSVLNPTTVFLAGGPNGVPAIVRSTNGGVSFTPIGTSGISLELYCIWAYDLQTIYVGDGGAAGGAGGNAKVYKTTDGGTTWTTILQTGGTVGFINGIVFSRSLPNIGIAQSDPPTNTTYWIAKTTNGGGNWVVENPPASGAASAQNSIVVIDQNFYGFGLNAAPARYGITTNGGANWTYATLVATGTSAFVSGAAFSNDKLNGVASTSTTTNIISRTTNGGLTWFSQTVPSTVTANGYALFKWVPGTSIVYGLVSSTSAASSFKSTDNGQTWTSLTLPSGLFNFTHMDLVYVSGTVYAYAVAADGSVIKLTDVIVDVKNPTANVPGEYKLMQNYPNPFNPITTINYSIPVGGKVQIKVFDLLGKEVAVVKDAIEPAGEHSVSFDASNLASGVYYYVMTSGNFTDTKKMVVAK